ncbi:MAG TPA: FtsX-like permease family protein, partial [Gemmatimonadaceae bacterium]|nr:FtsX-like permease family protein [Gemmatimonadaceae bacterium]
TLVLLVGAGLLVRSFDRLQRVDPGFDASNVLAAQVILPDAGYQSPAKVRDFWTRLAERARALPGATGSAVATMLPLSNGNDTYFYPEDQPPPTPDQRRTARINTVSDDYFATMRIPLIAGRAFGAPEQAAGDSDAHRGSVIINRQLAAQLFPGRSAVGQRLVVDFGSPFMAEIVGVAGDVRADGPDQDPPAMLFFSRHQIAGNFDGRIAQLAVRTRGAPEAIVGSLRRAVHELDPLVAIADVSTMDARWSDAVAPAQFRTRLLSAFAAAALALAMIGLYGVLAYAVTQRTREIGVRIAIGAPARALFGSVVRRGLVLVACGVVTGLVAAFAMSRLMAPLLFDVNPTDPLVFAAVPVLLITAGFAACSIPARRATRVDPLVALREE